MPGGRVHWIQKVGCVPEGLRARCLSAQMSIDDYQVWMSQFRSDTFMLHRIGIYPPACSTAVVRLVLGGESTPYFRPEPWSPSRGLLVLALQQARTPAGQHQPRQLRAVLSTYCERVPQRFPVLIGRCKDAKVERDPSQLGLGDRPMMHVLGLA
jgi:hypothetical protein